MARVKIELPEKFSFSCLIPVRITDINYGSHVGNDTVLSILHEARMQFLQGLGYTEMNFGGSAMIMADVAIVFKSELLYGDVVIASVAASEITKIGFELYYKLEVLRQDKKLVAAIAKTGMVCYDYGKQKIVMMSEEAKISLAG